MSPLAGISETSCNILKVTCDGDVVLWNTNRKSSDLSHSAITDD